MVAILGRDAGAWTELIRDEIGKPGVEALAGDVVPTLDALRWTIKHGRRSLRDVRVGRGMATLAADARGPTALVPRGRRGNDRDLELSSLSQCSYHRPGTGGGKRSGVEAVRAGRTHRPEDSSKASRRRACRQGLVTAVFGGSEVGQALVESDLDKGFFTGGIENGRRVIAGLGARGISGGRRVIGFRCGHYLAGCAFAQHGSCPDLGGICRLRTDVRRCQARLCCRGCAARGPKSFLPGPGHWRWVIPPASDRHRPHDLGPARERFDRQIQNAIRAGAGFWQVVRVSAGPAGSMLRPFCRRKLPRLRLPWRGLSARSF